jgi:hypothetical protein
LQDQQTAGVMAYLELWRHKPVAGGFCLDLGQLYLRCQGVRHLPEGRRTWALEWDVIVGDALIGEVGRGSV